MTRQGFAAGLMLLLFGGGLIGAQTVDDLKLQIHGYATQGFIYSTNNNWNTTSSSDGSAAWTEAVVNLTSEPQPRLHIGVEARYFLLGNNGNKITLDWAEADYRVNEKVGFRVGKVKTPSGLLNDIQDIDPAYLWVLLPQSVYPLASRDSILAHYGGVFYGKLRLGESFGSVEYNAFGGQRVVAADDGFLQQVENTGIEVPNGASGRTYGGKVSWLTPLRGLVLGASEDTENYSGAATLGGDPGTLRDPVFHIPFFFARFERNRVMLAGEYSRIWLNTRFDFQGLPEFQHMLDQREYYAMASYRLTNQLNTGIYFSSSSDHQAPITSARYQKDWALAARYDCNEYLYLKLEQHFVDGTALGYSSSDNANLMPNTRMTLLKVGVSF